MEVILKPGITLKEIYEIKRSLYQGRAYNYYIIEEKGKPGVHLQLTEVLLSKIPHQKVTEEWLNDQLDTLKEMSHPMLPSIKDGFLHEGNAYLVLSHSEGIALENYINMNVSALSVEESVDRVLKLIHVLKYFYDRPSPISFIHIDPPHVNVSDKGDMMLAGFGLHLFMDHYLSSPDPYACCAPEIAEGQPFSIRSAIYTLGTILYFFTTKKKWDSRKKDNPKPRELNKDIPESLQEIITTCLSKMPEYRYLEMEALMRKLDEVIHPPVPKKETTEAAVQEEAMFVKESRVIHRYLKIAGISLLGLFAIAMLIYAITGYILEANKAKESLFAYVLCGGKRSINCLDIKTGNPVKIIGIPGKASSITVAPDGKRLYVAREDKCITVIDPHRGVIVDTYPLKELPETILIGRRSEEQTAFICNRTNPFISLWNRESHEAMGGIDLGAGQGYSAISEDGSMLCALDSDKEEAILVDPVKKQCIKPIAAGVKPFRCALSSNGRILMVTSGEGTASFFDTQSYSLTRNVTVPAGKKYCAFSRKGSLAYIACEEGNMLYSVDCSTFAVMHKSSTKGVPRDIRVSPDGSLLYLLCASPNTLVVYDAHSLKIIKEMVPGFLEPCSFEVWP